MALIGLLIVAAVGTGVARGAFADGADPMTEEMRPRDAKGGPAPTNSTVIDPPRRADATPHSPE